jgi:2-iminoacetate synthase ThiH
MKSALNMKSILTDFELDGLADPSLRTVGEKLIQNERLTFDDGLACFNTKDLIGLGQLASAVKKSRYGDQAFSSPIIT